MGIAECEGALRAPSHGRIALRFFPSGSDLNDKLEAVVRHDLYTKYKTAPTPEQQEEARKEYLERAGIPQAFRW